MSVILIVTQERLEGAFVEYLIEKFQNMHKEVSSTGPLGQNLQMLHQDRKSNKENCEYYLVEDL